MIPRKLSLKNFLSYGEQLQSIDFSSYSLICLSGRNGHGKSALLDAITWALWGQARKISDTSKADAGLLRLGSSRMMVSFEFVLGEHCYRVRREYAKTYGKPYAALDFEVQQDKQGEFVSLTDKTIRRTQEKIEELIGLDFESFVNSAFLRQGQSNEFSKKSAKERKQILATILGLGRYDELQHKALEKARLFAEERRMIVNLQEQAHSELVLEKEIVEALGTGEREREKIEQDVATLVLQQQVIMQKEAELASHIHLCEQAEQKKRYLEKGIEEELSSFRTTVVRWKRVHVSMLVLADIKSLENRKQIFFAQEEQMRQLQEKSLQLQEAILYEKGLYQKQEALLQAAAEKKKYEERGLLQEHEFLLKQAGLRVKHLEGQLEEQMVMVKKQQEERYLLQLRLASTQIFEKQLGVTKQQFEKRRSYYQVFTARGAEIDRQLVDMQHKKETLSQTTSPSCPLCEQVLTVTRKKFLYTKFIDQERLFVRQRERFLNILKKLKAFLLEQHAHINQLEKQQNEFMQDSLKDQELVRLQIEGENTIRRLQEELFQARLIMAEKEKVYELKKQDVEQKNLYSWLQDESLKRAMLSIEKLLKEQKELSYSKEHHNIVLEECKKIDAQIKECDVLQKEAQEQRQRQHMVRQLKNKIKGMRYELAELIEHILVIKKLLQGSSELLMRKKQIEESLAIYMQAKERLLRQMGSLHNQQERLQRIKIEIHDRDKKLMHMTREIDCYQELGQMFGKNGLQALLIEEAIPEIENEANALLTRLTDNQSYIFIESLRDLKKGGVKETLDIKIADAVGVRPYEMFSGGEAFRIDFALRIAISKLLARRAGTALQTLIIDEGFGSQDDEGLQRLMDAIYAIRDDFSKIIVVSHLPIFKENFPVHIIVEKGTLGSGVHIQERG